MTPTRTTYRIAILALAGLVTSCSSPTGPAFEALTADALETRIGSGVTFLTMRIDPDVHMEALFQGRVLADEEGCLRLDTEDRHTVVWPKGYGFYAPGSTIWILDAGGEVIGRVGEDFRLGGGEVTELHDGLGFTAADRALAEAHCPGRYWIASPE